jgi:hypothetical protein
MKKLILPISAVLLFTAWIAFHSFSAYQSKGSATALNPDQIEEAQKNAPVPKQADHLTDNSKARESDPNSTPQARRGAAMSLDHDGVSNLQPNAEQRNGSPATARSPLTSLKPLESAGPSIGAVKVLGHRGCDTNTMGWYLGKGKPEEYDYTESDDGETLVVQPNMQNLTGAFEFVHCVDSNLIAGKHIQFQVRLKAQDVKDTAQLRFWGENPSRERILFKSEEVTGTYDWREFTIDADVDPAVTLFNYGITFRSSGKLWVSHPVLSISP